MDNAAMAMGGFFGAVVENLRLLAEARASLPFSAGGRIAGVEELTKGDAAAPANLRVWDLLSSGGRRCVRVFAWFAETADPAAIPAAKFAIRRWHQESGWAGMSGAPRRGAFAMAAPCAWPADAAVGPDDPPMPGIALSLLVSPCGAAADGGSPLARAFRPLSFTERKAAVEKCMIAAFDLPEGGNATVARIADECGVAPDEVALVFRELAAEGRIGLKRNGRLAASPHDALYATAKPAPWFRRIFTRRGGPWYAKGGR